MPTDSDHETLIIQTVNTGFYQGFNPIVAMLAKAVILLIVAALVTMPDTSAVVLDRLKSGTLSVFAGWYIYLLAIFVVFNLVLVILPVSGKTVLGPDRSLPDHSTQSWLSMMFCAGIGIGILVFSVSEPISHSASNPDLLNGDLVPGSEANVVSALRFTYLHWGVSAWGCYAVIGLALGLSCHRHGQPMTMRSAVAVLFGKSLERAPGHIIDVIAILAIVSGITTTIVLGLEQICTGLSELTGSPFFADNAGNPPLTALLTALVIALSVAIASVVSGVDRGVKWTSQLGIILSFGVLVIFVTFGAGTRVFGIFADSSIAYLATLPQQIFTLYDPSASEVSAANRAWQENWTVFYWAWWIAFAPFVGLFLARISRGRTIREFILGAMLGPTAMCFIWFAGTGGTALLLEHDGIAAGRIADAEHAFRIYETVDVMLGPTFAAIVKVVLVFLFLVLIVASSTAAIVAIKSIGAAGSGFAETPFHSAMWAFVIAAMTGAVMAVGGVESIRDVMIVGALPFSVIMAAMLPAIVVMIRSETRTGRLDTRGALSGPRGAKARRLTEKPSQ